MARERSKIRMTEIRRAGKALQSMGVSIRGLEVGQDRFAFITGAQAAPHRELDEWLEKKGKDSADAWVQPPPSMLPVLKRMPRIGVAGLVGKMGLPGMIGSTGVPWPTVSGTCSTALRIPGGSDCVGIDTSISSLKCNTTTSKPILPLRMISSEAS